MTEGIHPALQRAKDVAGDKDVRVGGGVATIRQYLQAGLIDELHLAARPIFARFGREFIRTAAPVPAVAGNDKVVLRELTR